MDLATYLPWIVFLHVVSVFVFVAGHGVSLIAIFRIRAERDPSRLAAYLDLSRTSLGLAFAGLAGILVFGIVAGLVAGDFGRLWLWASIGLFLVVGGVMTPMGAIPLNRIRFAMGRPVGKPKPGEPAPVAIAFEQVVPMLDALRPDVLGAIGGGGFLVILYLMTFKPF